MPFRIALAPYLGVYDPGYGDPLGGPRKPVGVFQDYSKIIRSNAFKLDVRVKEGGIESMP